MTPDNFKFSIKLNRIITHYNSLELNEETVDRISYILNSTQVLKDKIGAIAIQLPASFKLDVKRLDTFLNFFKNEVDKGKYRWDVAIEFRNKYWFNVDIYNVLRQYNVALIYGQSSRYPGTQNITADFTYIRMHGPGKLFTSKYTTKDLEVLGTYIKSISKNLERIYIYFNNDYYGYALENAKELMGILK